MQSKKATFRATAGVFFVALVLFLGIRWILIEPYVIPSGSMTPTLMINDHILVSKYDYGLRIPFSKIWLQGPRLPKKGDIVVFESVETVNMTMIKRVAGLPGDEINVNDEVVVVPEGHIYLLGDNRENSRDSRYWGALPIQNIIGRARMIWLSCEKTLSNVDMLCDPRFIHWHRMFSRIE